MKLRRGARWAELPLEDGQGLLRDARFDADPGTFADLMTRRSGTAKATSEADEWPERLTVAQAVAALLRDGFS